MNLHTLDENVFLYYALRDMIDHEGNGGERQKCIMQYLRFRNHLFHISVQQKTIKGLDYFQQAHYSVNSALNHANKGEREGIGVEILVAGYQRLFADDTSQFENEEKFRGIQRDLCEMLRHGKKVVWDARLLAAARHCKKFVKEMERPIHYAVTEQDILIVEELQKILKEKLGKKGIVIEVNPSSNMAIADLDGMEENQLYQLDGRMDQQNLIVCINSDDPAVFNTNVSNELAYIYYGMLEKNISREAALLWIDKIRRNGMNSSFIHHQETDVLLMKNLKALIQEM